MNRARFIKIAAAGICLILIGFGVYATQSSPRVGDAREVLEQSFEEVSTESGELTLTIRKGGLRHVVSRPGFRRVDPRVAEYGEKIIVGNTPLQFAEHHVGLTIFPTRTTGGVDVVLLKKSINMSSMGGDNTVSYTAMTLTSAEIPKELTEARVQEIFESAGL